MTIPLKYKTFCHGGMFLYTKYIFNYISLDRTSLYLSSSELELLSIECDGCSTVVM